MTESSLHFFWKNQLCNVDDIKRTQTEKFILDKKYRIDCFNPNEKICGEVELNRNKIPYAIHKLNEALQKGVCEVGRLGVRDKDVDFAMDVSQIKNIEVIGQSEQSKYFQCDINKKSEISKCMNSRLSIFKNQ